MIAVHVGKPHLGLVRRPLGFVRPHEHLRYREHRYNGEDLHKGMAIRSVRSQSRIKYHSHYINALSTLSLHQDISKAETMGNSKKRIM
jgi:hypothetical protein